ncbi:PH domain-containing protein [Flavobacterium tegetincola]|uniref:PH domain-containing protein n=1 Tax=Flavobacterium tegetincola TaxID=150172 RepID=UPI000414D839|nr:PH domain-containing protein [Flavobacterium tegetincola]
MKATFNQPQRQSKVGIIVMFVYTLQQFGRALFPIILIYFFKSENLNMLLVVPGVIALLALLGLYAYLSFLNFTFYIDEENEEFVINEGIFNKTKTAIQLSKIQQVNINQTLIQKIIGVYALEVDTAGSAKKEGAIKAISHQLALALKSRLLENEAKIVQEVAIDSEEMPKILEDPKPFIKIGFATLLKIGITSNYLRSIGLLFLFYSYVRENLRNFSEKDFLNGSQIDTYFSKQSILQGVLTAGVILIIIVLLVNIVRTVVKFFGFTISKQKGSLLLSFGLFNTKSTIIKPEKVQITTITRNFFQRKMDILEIKIQQAKSGDAQSGKDSIEIPGCNELEKNEILKLIFSTIPEKGVLLKPNWRKLVFGLFTGIVVPLSIYFGFGFYVEPLAFDYAFLAVGYTIFVAVLVYFGYRNSRLFVNQEFIILQTGAWDVDNRIIEIEKIQALTTSQLFWHKSPDIGSLTIHTAGGDIQFQLGNFTTVKNYVNLWLYNVEANNVNWM